MYWPCIFDESTEHWHPYSSQRSLFIFWRKCRTLASSLQPKESIYILTKQRCHPYSSQECLIIFWRKCRTLTSLLQPQESIYILTKVQNGVIPTPTKGVYLYSDESAELWHPDSSQRSLFIFWRKCRTLASLLQPKESIYILTTV